jgi:hypothetical protein
VIVETGKKSRTEFTGNVCVKLCGTVMVTEIRKGEIMMTSMKEEILDNAMAAVGEREFTHGECVSNNKNIAELWSAYLSVPITADEVAIMMLLLKVGRTKSRTAIKDHYVDMAGYAAIAGQIVLGDKNEED